MSRNYVLVNNNWTEESYAAIVAKKYKYLMIGKEVGEQGTRHLQCFIIFPSARSLSGVIKDFPGCHVEACKGNAQQNINYIADNPVKPNPDYAEFGIRPLTQTEKGSKASDKYKQQWDLAKEGNYLCLPPGQIKTWEYINAKYGEKPPLLHAEVPHLWYYGDTGTGKSRKAREDNPDAYIKDATKWWGGYQDQEVVILEDLDDDNALSKRDIKIWMDRYPFPAEAKGLDSRLIRPRQFIVTSNYHPSEIWPNPKDHLPILRRFTLKEFKALEPTDCCEFPRSGLPPSILPRVYVRSISECK